MILGTRLNNAFYVDDGTPAEVTLTTGALAAVADAVWDELKTSHTIIDSYGKILADLALQDFKDKNTKEEIQEWVGEVILDNPQSGGICEKELTIPEVLEKYMNTYRLFIDITKTEEVAQQDSYFMEIYNDDGTSLVETASWLDEDDNPSMLVMATKVKLTT